MKKALIVLFLVVLITLTGVSLSQPNALFAQAAQQGAVSVQAIIPPHVSDFQFAFGTSTGSPVHQNQRIHYDIVYGAQESAGQQTTNTIVVHYTNDRTPDGNFAADYVIGSATEGYWGAQPVVDLINRTITWTLVNLPPGTVDQKVSFELQANSTYTLSNTVQFVSRAGMSNEFITIPDSSVYLNYRYDPAANPPPPTPTINLTPQPSPTPDVTLLRLQINDIALRSLSSSQATVAVSANKPIRTKIVYGTSPAAMSQTQTTAGYQPLDTATLDNLKANTPYFYQVTAYDELGHYFITDILTFTTPSTSAPTALQSDATMTVTSANTLLLSALLKANLPNEGLLFLPINNNYFFTFTPTNGIQNIASLDLIIQSASGIERQVNLLPAGASFTGIMQTSPPGIYDMILTQTDSDGNVMSRKVSTLKISPLLTVLDAFSNDPLGDARVEISRYNTQTKRYDPLSGQTYFYTDKDGQGQILLAPGNYRAVITALGYDGKTVDFALGAQAGQEYPQVHLTKNLLNTAYLYTFLKDTLTDAATQLIMLFNQLSTSIRYYNVVSFGSLFSLTILTSLLLHWRTNIRLGSSLPFMLFHLAVLGKRHTERYLYGTVNDKSEKPLGNVLIEVTSLADPTVLMHTITDTRGNFHIKNTFAVSYIKLILSKDGYPITELIVETTRKTRIVIQLGKTQTKMRSLGSILFRDLSSGFFEIVLLVSLASELVFLGTFGVVKTLPFILLSLFNLLLWIFYERKNY